MKIISKKLLATILLLAIAVSPLRAQTNDAKEIETVDAVETVPPAPAAANNTAPKVTNDSALEDENPPVRIDATGIHVGGKNPVDIGIPSGSPGSHIGNVAIWIPIIAILMIFGMPIAIVGLFFYFRHRKTKMLHETLRAMVEKGVAIPPELFAASESGRAARPENYSSAPPSSTGAPPIAQVPPFPSTPRRYKNDLRNGLITAGVGAGVTALAGKVGLIILFIGVAMVVSVIIETIIDRKDRN